MQYTSRHRNIVLTIVASVILITASYAVFGWSDPGGAPPESSLPIPLDTGSADQIKTGGLKVKSLATDALYVNNVQKDTVWDAKEPEISNGTDLQYFRGDKTWQTLNTTTVPEGTNLYFTDARAQAALQTQLNDKASLANPMFTGNVTMPGTGIWNSSGKVGIGKTNPGYLLDVNGVLNATDIYKNGAPFLAGNSQWNTVGSDINYTSGKVGIGTANPITSLDVNGSIKSKNYSINIAEFLATNYGKDYENGPNKHIVKIKTNFPYTNGSQMPALFIEGYDYGGANTLGVNLVWYIYGGNFINYRASSYGSVAPKITLANEGGKAVILLEKPVGTRWYYSRFTIRALLMGNSEWLKGWTFAAEPVSGTNVVAVPYNNAFGNGYFSGNVGIGTTSPQSALHIPDGKYLQAEDNNASAPPVADCDNDAERGRISLDTTNFRLYICAGAARGWDYSELSD